MNDGGGGIDRAWLLYGAYGFTGELIAREAVSRGQRPVLAGRSRARTEALARELDLPCRVFDLEDGSRLREGLAGIAAVLHAAGPFSATYRAMVQACLDVGCHYVDITGEIDVLEGVLALGNRAREAGVVLLPGAGFDVVPSDCLAVRLAGRIPRPSHLDIAFIASGRPSAGTLKGVVEGLSRPGRIRSGGRLVDVPHGAIVRMVPFSDRSRRCVSIPWGDVSTAWHSTGVASVRVFTPMPGPVHGMTRALAWLGGRAAVRGAALKVLDRFRGGPGGAELARGRARVWAEVRNEAGERASGELTTPNAYAFTADSACEAVLELLDARATGPAPGAWTPAKALGSGFVDRLSGVSWTLPVQGATGGGGRERDGVVARDK